MASSNSNDPSLVAKALAKAQSVESRLNALVGTSQNPQTPTVLYSLGGGGSQVVVTTSANGNYTWTCPAGVYSAMIECWGAGAGAGGGSSGEGGEGGGGGEYAQEPLFVTVPGTVYNYSVGNGGAGAPSGGGGTGGGDTSFNSDGSGTTVYANGGDSGGGFTGGPGGTGSSNTIHFNGGQGGGQNDQSTGGCGGGGSGGSTGAGGGGTSSGSSTGTAGGAAGTGGGAAGGHGGNSAANGSTGSSPGAGGGGCGAATGGSVINKTYSATGNRSYYGHDATGNPDAVRTTNGTLYQGGETATGGTYNGTQKFVVTFDAGLMASDFSGATITACSFQITCNHTWYGSGMTINLREWPNSGGAPTSWNGTSSPVAPGIYNSTIVAGQQKTFSLGTTVGNHFIAGTTHGIACGPGVTPYDLNYYGYFSGGSSPNILMSGSIGVTVNAGAGSDGQVKITYTPAVTTNVVAAVQPAAVADDGSGNALAAGFTGPVVAVDPVLLNAPETWTKVASLPSGVATSGNGVAGFWYRMNPDGFVEALYDLALTSLASGASILSVGTLPSAYCPNGANSGVNAGVCCCYGTIPAPPTGAVIYLEILNNGGALLRGASASTGSFAIAGSARWWPGTL